jgi:predicted transport protein
MSDIKLFRLAHGKASELKGEAGEMEKALQGQIETNLEVLLGIRLLASEYSTGKTHGGRIATLGVDENSCPVIVEYKRSVADSVINQGLFYLDWLLDHQAEFRFLVMEVLGKPAAENIDWSAPRLVCIAADFSRYDAHAALQINRNIELIRYRRFGNELLLLELASAFSPNSERGSAGAGRRQEPAGTTSGRPSGERSFADALQSLPTAMAELMHALEDHLLALGDDVQRNEMRQHVAYRRLKNFASVAVQKSRLLLFLHLDPTPWIGKLASARDVRRQGHVGTGDLELSLTTPADLEAAKPLIGMAYEGRSDAVPTTHVGAVNVAATDSGPAPQPAAA